MAHQISGLDFLFKLSNSCWPLRSWNDDTSHKLGWQLTTRTCAGNSDFSSPLQIAAVFGRTLEVLANFQNMLKLNLILDDPQKKFNIAPEKSPSQKESSLPTIHFQGLCWTSGVYTLKKKGESHKKQDLQQLLNGVFVGIPNNHCLYPKKNHRFFFPSEATLYHHT